MFYDGSRGAVFQKPLFSFPEEGLKKNPVVPENTLVFEKSPQLWDDIALAVTFASTSAAHLFQQELEHRRKLTPSRTITKIYVQESPGSAEAKLLRGQQELQDVVNSVLTAVSHSSAARALVPAVLDGQVVTWEYTLVAVQACINQCFQKRLPPIVVIARDASKKPFLQNDIEGSVESLPDFRNVLRWWLPQWSSSAEHLSNQADNSQVVLPYELVQLFLATQAACVEDSEDERALSSHKAATASIKLTLLRELAHCWVNSTTDLDIRPLRPYVDGAESPWCNVAVADNSSCIGNLVETVWLGGPHGLIVDQDGWLRLVIKTFKDEATDAVDQVDAANPSLNRSPSSSASSSTESGPQALTVQGIATSSTGHVQSFKVVPPELLSEIWEQPIPRLPSSFLPAAKIKSRPTAQKPRSPPIPAVRYLRTVRLIPGTDLPPRWPSVLHVK